MVTLRTKLGKQFERTLAKSWSSCGLPLERIRISDLMAEAPCDEVIIYENILYLEAKSTSMKFFNFRNISSHQLRSLKSLSEKRENTEAGVIIEFWEIKQLLFIPIRELLNLIKLGITSIMPDDKDPVKRVGIVIGYDFDNERYPVEKILEYLEDNYEN